METKDSSRRDKLGLSLAGGGFRASLFHLGVLRRMAELDLMRSVEVLSTVSGGSIIGALYVLLLKKYLDREQGSRLSRDQYIAIIDELDECLTTAIQKDLRTRLFLNPFGILRVMLTEHSLGKRMARLYERYLYRRVVADLNPEADSWWQPGKILLREVRMKPGGEEINGGLEAYNRMAVKQGGSVITNLILNATSLNSGARFWFSSAEVGDWYLGHFRYDEIPDLMKRKNLLQQVARDKVPELLRSQLDDASVTQIEWDGTPYDRDTIALALWRHAQRGRENAAPPPGWEDLFGVPGFPGPLSEAAFGLLRQAKLAAWHLYKGFQQTLPVTGGLTESEHLIRFWGALRAIDAELETQLRAFVGNDPARRSRLLHFILELYWLRSAEVASPRLEGDWNKLTLGEAVGASACFPPVFPPFVVLGFYDDAHVSRLGLTDGGVFDNIGITALLDEQCTQIIASDTSGVFGVQERAASGRLGLSVRITNVLMKSLAGFQQDGLRERRRVSNAIDSVQPLNSRLHEFQALRALHGLAFFHIQSPPVGQPGLALPLHRALIANLRTDLDSFGDVEIAALVDHGYDTADQYIRTYLTAYQNAYWTPPIGGPPKPISKEEHQVNRILKAGSARFFRALKLGALVSWGFILTAVAALVWCTLGVQISPNKAVQRLSEGIGDGLSAWLENSVPFIGGLMDTEFSVGIVLLVILAAMGFYGLFKTRLVERIREHDLVQARQVAWFFKWLRSYSGNLLWLFGWLPAAVALLSCLLASVSYVFFNLPFLCKTRLPRTAKRARKAVQPPHPAGPAAPEPVAAQQLSADPDVGS